jgi:hypothetical protein
MPPTDEVEKFFTSLVKRAPVTYTSLTITYDYMPPNGTQWTTVTCPIRKKATGGMEVDYLGLSYDFPTVGTKYRRMSCSENTPVPTPVQSAVVSAQVSRRNSPSRDRRAEEDQMSAEVTQLRSQMAAAQTGFTAMQSAVAASQNQVQALSVSVHNLTGQVAQLISAPSPLAAVQGQITSMQQLLQQVQHAMTAQQQALQQLHDTQATAPIVRPPAVVLPSFQPHAPAPATPAAVHAPPLAPDPAAPTLGGVFNGVNPLDPATYTKECLRTENLPYMYSELGRLVGATLDAPEDLTRRFTAAKRAIDMLSKSVDHPTQLAALLDNTDAALFELHEYVAAKTLHIGIDKIRAKYQELIKPGERSTTTLARTVALLRATRSPKPNFTRPKPENGRGGVQRRK